MNRKAACLSRLGGTRQGGALFLLCWVSYAGAYVGRYNYSAVMGAITAEGALTLPAAGMISTGYFVCYAAGQLLSGLMCQRMSPFGMIFAGLSLSGACNLAMAAVPPGWMAPVWAVNGLFQAMVWPPIVRLFAECMPLAQQKGACVNINSTTPAGTLAAYGLCALLLAAHSWRTAFLACGGLLLALSALWLAATARLRRAAAPRTPRENAPRAEPAASPKGGALGPLAAAGLVWLLVPVLLHGGLKDGVTSWVPSMIQDRFAVSPALSSAVSMLLPLVNISGAYLADWLDRRVVHNEMKTAAVLFACSAACLCGLPFAVRFSLPLSIVLLSLVTALMLGINTIFINVMPVRAGHSGGAALLSGALNAVTYLGAAAATWGVGASAGLWGWGAVFLLWILMSGAALCVSAACVNRWTRFVRQRDASERSM